MNRNVKLAGMRAVSLDSIFEERETCNECEIESVINTCNKCGNGVCKQKQCSWKFPGKYKSIYILCNGCYKEIDRKLINYDHMVVYKFLKKNMKKRRVSCST
jgi:hypothetical protein|tara:strand:+ start:149 stop:454 length:306 start_codon:yes stop_codon:yes gene_type:complete